MSSDSLSRLSQRSAALGDAASLVRIAGHVADITPTHYRVRGLSPFARLGDCVALNEVSKRHGEVIRVDKEHVTIKPFAGTSDVRLGASVVKLPPFTLAPDLAWRGRIINAMGEPVDGLGPLPVGSTRQPIHREPPPALQRGRVTSPLRTGVRLIDIFAPLCHGQRIGIFAGSGVGKSTLLGMLAGSLESAGAKFASSLKIRSAPTGRWR